VNFEAGSKVREVTPELADIAFEGDVADFRVRHKSALGELMVFKKVIVHGENRLRFRDRHKDSFVRVESIMKAVRDLI